MKNQMLNLLSVSIILVLALTLVSAANITFESKTLSKSIGTNTVSIEVRSDVAQEVSFSVINNPNEISFNSISNVIFTSGDLNKTIFLVYTVSDEYESNLETEDVAVLVAKVASTSTELSRQEYSFEKSYCAFDTVGKIEIDVDDEEADNSDSWEWKPFNNIELTVNVENNANEDMSGTIEYCLFDEDEEECVIEDELDFDVDEGEDDDFTIGFTLNPSDLTLESNNYRLYIKAYDDDEWDESEQCAEFTESIDITINKDEVMIDEDKIVVPEVINAGDTITIEVPVYNVGSKDQEDVTVQFYSKTLSIARMEGIVGDIDSGDEEKVLFTFKVPTTALEGKNYELVFEIYDEDDDIYELEDNDGDEYDAVFTKVISVTEGASSSSTSTNSPKASVSAELFSDAKSGEEIIVTAEISNIGRTTNTFTLNALGYTAWADSVKLSQTSVLLNSGESKEITLTFQAKSSAEGANKFNLEVLSGDSLVTSQAVSVEIEKSSFSFSNLFSFEGNWYLWAIGAFNVILVVAIIVVVVRLLKK
jgi:hypothetical protein